MKNVLLTRWVLLFISETVKIETHRIMEKRAR